MDVREKLAELLEEAPYNIYGDRLGSLWFKSGLEIAAGYLIARGVTLQTQITEEDKTMTNADRIRSMSDGELKKFICSMFKCEFCDFELGERCGLLNWLQQPAGDYYGKEKQ